MVTINMSEFKNESDVSKLKGTTAGFVGYGQGGVLTNAVRNRPYSVVLLDEFEKAHPGVYELFFQVFDKGTLSDDRSEVNFKNCIILLTANVGTDTIMKHCADPDTVPTADALAEIMRPELETRFSPALLGRIKVVPFFPLQESVLKQIIKLKLKKIGNRLAENYKSKFNYTPAVVEAVAARCTEVSSGARNVDHILTGTLLPQLAQELLARMAEGRPVKNVTVDVNAESQFTYEIV
jgi:type VI secretion system protein VasG